MEEILKYENRDKLYDFLIKDFGLVKTEEYYDEKAFGNFYIILSAKDFLLSYVNDRSFLTIDIASKLEPSGGLALSFVKDLLYNPNEMNNGEVKTNEERIRELNDFLRKDFEKICLLFNENNYYETKKHIDELLLKQFRKKNPGML
jgi:hypothetical protein